MILDSLKIMMSFWPSFTSNEEGEVPGSEDIQKRLIKGNQRYTNAKSIHPNQTDHRRKDITKEQHPFAVILSCADSRVPPEIIFDQGLGDLFVIRIAGNILNDEVLGSIEYAIEHLGVGYIMVLGHKHCGAVHAALKGGKVPGHIGSIIKAIQPAIREVKNKFGGSLDNAVKANVSLVVEQLKSSVPIMAKHIKKGDLTIKGAYYDLDNGTVEILP